MIRKSEKSLMSKEEDECKEARYDSASAIAFTDEQAKGELKILDKTFKVKILRMTRYRAPPLRAGHTCFTYIKPGKTFIELEIIDEYSDKSIHEHTRPKSKT